MIREYSQASLECGDAVTEEEKQGGIWQSMGMWAGTSRHSSAQLIFFKLFLFYFLHSDFTTPATDPDACAENSMHLLSLFIT